MVDQYRSRADGGSVREPPTEQAQTAQPPASFGERPTVRAWKALVELECGARCHECTCRLLGARVFVDHEQAGERVQAAGAHEHHPIESR